MSSRVLLYNPLNMLKQEVYSVFTAREDQAEFILKSIKDQTEYKTPQHYLIIGPRGIGKTILLRYLHCRIQDDIYINSHWEVVQFSEEEYGIRTLADFFRKVVERLLEHYEESELADSFNQITEDEELFNDSESYQFLITRFCTVYNKRILVFADNFDYIIRKNISEQERAGLRKYLLLKNHIVLVATTVSLFNELEEYEEPFFDFFAPIRIKRLTMEQGIELIRKLA